MQARRYQRELVLHRGKSQSHQDPSEPSNLRLPFRPTNWQSTELESANNQSRVQFPLTHQHCGLLTFFHHLLATGEELRLGEFAGIDLG